MCKRINLYKNCLQCNSLFKTLPSIVAKGSGKYCSNICKGRYIWKNPEYAKKMSEVHKGQIPVNLNSLIKRARSKENMDYITNLMKGKKPWNWIEDRSKLKKYNTRFAASSASVYWAKEIRKRDGGLCRLRNENCRGNLEVHHILPWRDYPEERFNLNNGITLCHGHHPRKHNEEKKMMPILKELVKVINY